MDGATKLAVVSAGGLASVLGVAYADGVIKAGRVRDAIKNPPDRKVVGEQVSVIIPTLNEENYLPVLLDTIDHQTYSPIEVIVADSHSDDRTVEIATSRECEVVVSEPPDPSEVMPGEPEQAKWTAGVAKGRNDGAEVASGNILNLFRTRTTPSSTSTWRRR